MGVTKQKRDWDLEMKSTHNPYTREMRTNKTNGGYSNPNRCTCTHWSFTKIKPALKEPVNWAAGLGQSPAQHVEFCKSGGWQWFPAPVCVYMTPFLGLTALYRQILISMWCALMCCNKKWPCIIPINSEKWYLPNQVLNIVALLAAYGSNDLLNVLNLT